MAHPEAAHKCRTDITLVQNRHYPSSPHPYLGCGVDHVQVIDQLCQVLNGVDVVVWRGADEGHSGLAAAQVGDVGRHLLAGQLTTFSGLGTLQTVKTAPGVDVSVESKQDCPISSHNVKYVGLAYFLTVG